MNATETPTAEQLRNRDGIDILRQMRGEFPQSLASQFDEGGKPLTEKQWFWVGKLAYDHLTKPPEPEAVHVDLEPIMAMFAKAGETLKRPKVRISDGSEKGEICFSIAGPRSRYSGDIMVTDGKAFGENKFYGRISQGGTLNPSRHCTETITQKIQAFSEHPAEVSAAYGRLTGRCSFCGLELKAGTSLLVGRGPVCSDKFGLWYPSKAELKVIQEEAAASE